jgi:para-nitrobenzyl esterase
VEKCDIVKLLYNAKTKVDKVMKITKSLFLISLVVSGSINCQTVKNDVFKLKFSPLPIDLGGIAARFSKDIAYGADPLQRFDIFLPEGRKESVPLVLFIHGGGFTGGDKAEIYKNPKRVADIAAILAKGIAFATINYRLLRPDDTTGVRKCLNDSKYCLQFIRRHAASAGIDKDRIAAYGYSAGAGTGLWLGLHDDMKDEINADPVLRESTRLKAVVARETQASYDLKRWESDVFADFPTMNLAQIVQIAGGPKIFAFYGIDRPADFNSPAVQAYRADIDLPALMDAQDAPLWVENDNSANEPTKRGELFHHPFHARAIKKSADAAGLSCLAYIPAIPGLDVLSMDHIEFLAGALRK